MAGVGVVGIEREAILGEVFEAGRLDKDLMYGVGC
jgi:hypothetical protein